MLRYVIRILACKVVGTVVAPVAPDVTPGNHRTCTYIFLDVLEAVLILFVTLTSDDTS
jgi:hypothetical protein